MKDRPPRSIGYKDLPEGLMKIRASSASDVVYYVDEETWFATTEGADVWKWCDEAKIWVMLF